MERNERLKLLEEGNTEHATTRKAFADARKSTTATTRAARKAFIAAADDAASAARKAFEAARKSASAAAAAARKAFAVARKTFAVAHNAKTKADLLTKLNVRWRQGHNPDVELLPAGLPKNIAVIGLLAVH